MPFFTARALINLCILLIVLLVALLPALITSRRLHHRQRNHHHHHYHHLHRQHPDPHPYPLSAESGISNNSRAKYKRQAALNLAVNRLHILESLDGQLREFAARNANADADADADANPEPDQEVCSLGLRFGQPTSRTGRESGNCPSAAVPPYMLNLQRELLHVSESLADAVRLMPYESLVARSFRQPPLAHNALQLDGSSEAGEQRNKGPLERQSNVVVELSIVEANEFDSTRSGEEELEMVANEHHHAIDDETSPKQLTSHDEQVDRFASHQMQTPSTACDLNQRSLMAHERSQLCYWFRIGEALRMKINGSLASSSANSLERLLEAELHVFKLLPEMEQTSGEVDFKRSTASSNSDSNSNSKSKPKTKASTKQSVQKSNINRGHTNRLMVNRGQSNNQTATPINKSPTKSLYYLKTNLLEVSLYQILPTKKTSSYSNASSKSLYGNGAKQEEKLNDKDFPLRLLDIRRIDLHSSGWETFYVKRAVEDWIRDPSLNLGLAIKAKSMFDEPIKIGLIRFADLYDHQRVYNRNRQYRHNSEQMEEVGWIKKKKKKRRRRDEEALEFDSSHQPILVIYTTTANVSQQIAN